MSLNNFLLYLLAGRLLTFLLQTTGLLRPLWKAHPLLKELSECDLCLGFWVFLGLGQRKPFGLWPGLVERVVLAALASFGAHLLRLGWESKFGGMVID